MAKKKVKTAITLEDDAVQKILTELLEEFRRKNLVSEDLRRGYKGLSPELLKSSCGDQGISEVDFDLAIKDLIDAGLVKTGPMVMYDNKPNSSVFILSLYSKNEFSYLTEDGYKVGTKLRTSRPPKPIVLPNVHISGGTFNHSPIGVGNQVAQSVTISASGSEQLLDRLREEIWKQIEDEKKRSEILERLAELEIAKDRSSMLTSYTQLVGVIGDHITVLGFLLPPVLEMIMRHS